MQADGTKPESTNTESRHLSEPLFMANQNTRLPSRGLGQRWGRRWGLSMVAISAALLTACERKAGYSQKSPEAVVETAVLMVKNGDVQLLPQLIYAESKEGRIVLQRTGQLFKSLSLLAKDLEVKFPKEVGELKAQAEAAAKEGKASSLLGEVMSQVGGQSTQNMARRRPPQPDGAQQEQFQSAMSLLFADPFSMLTGIEKKVSTVPIDNDTVAVLYDGKMVAPPLGLLMRRKDDRWYVALPSNIPMVQQYLPQNRSEFQIVASLIRVIDNAVIDLRKDVNSGEVQNLEDLSRKTGEKAFIPAMLTFFAYGKAVENRLQAGKADAAPTTPAPAAPGGK